MKLFHKSTDERVNAEINRIYRIGYYILCFGILADIIWQAASGQGIRWIEFAVFMAANIACAVLMARKGMMDDNAYAEADVFPAAHYAKLSAAVGALLGVVYPVLLYCTNQFWSGMSLQHVLLAGGVTFACLSVPTAGLLFLAFYASFRAAKKRRDRENAEFDEK